ncbi:Calcium-binding endonuclease/exonuclease/phosphatase family [Quillaja saponaria]|uniref:Calcium-binding endonuclease/exonuclease/phosphatase family n=1 Tax=Quillaja saponaria TaxID=32244 RepID=A0AAD7PE27_QUISA|nr:Calcium-binding endonuclease/exonuclease/phosphatase family [Quillaja saponaria]
MAVVAGSNVAKLNAKRRNDTAPLVNCSISNSECFSSMTLAGADRDPSCISCTTFNILAPIYKRIDPKNPGLRESDFSAFWLARNQRILDWLLHESSSIICLQEFWVGNEELTHMYLDRLGNAGYQSFKLARTNNRGDGLLTAICKEYLNVVDYRELLLNDFGDRVAQLLHVKSVVPFVQNQKGNFKQQFLIVNTHLLFPHDSSLSLVRLHQVYQILQYVESYQKENKLNPMPIILCGDWNGSKRGHVYKFLRSQGFVSSYDTAHQYTDSDADAHKWVSHCNHRGNICGVDFIWLCNPNESWKPLKTSWAEAVFGIFKYQLQKASLTDDDAFAFLKDDNYDDFVTYSSFCEALRQVKLIGLPCGLSLLEVKDLWTEADLDGNGVLDFEEFKKIWNSVCSERGEEDVNVCVEDSKSPCEEETVGFKVKNAVLFPREVERGMWPEDYSLSDHARLTVTFSPVRMQCSRPDKFNKSHL